MSLNHRFVGLARGLFTANAETRERITDAKPSKPIAATLLTAITVAFAVWAIAGQPAPTHINKARDARFVERR